jgi:hypothetical protein
MDLIYSSDFDNRLEEPIGTGDIGEAVVMENHVEALQSSSNDNGEIVDQSRAPGQRQVDGCSFVVAFSFEDCAAATKIGA